MSTCGASNWHRDIFVIARHRKDFRRTQCHTARQGLPPLSAPIFYACHFSVQLTCPLTQRTAVPRVDATSSIRLSPRLGQGADHGRMAPVAGAWDRSTAPGATSRSQSRAQAYVFNVFGWLAEA